MFTGKPPERDPKSEGLMLYRGHYLQILALTPVSRMYSPAAMCTV